MAAWVVPVVASVLGAGSSILQGLFNRSAQSEANAQNVGLSREQMAWQEAMWNKQNAYNLPSAQMERYKQAGLNPNLIYGQSNMAGSVGSYTRANVQPEGLELGILPVISQFMDMQVKQAQADNLKAQNDLIRQQVETEFYRSGISSEDLENKQYDNILKRSLLLRDTVFPDGMTSEPTEYSTIYPEAKAAELKQLIRQYQLQGKDLFLKDKDLSLKDMDLVLKSLGAEGSVLENKLKSKELSYTDAERLISIITKIFGSLGIFLK
jgi:hypothetical protein